MDQVIDGGRTVTAYDEVINGETRQGWSVVISSRDLHKYPYGEGPILERIRWYAPTTWTTDHPDELVNWEPKLSIDWPLFYPFPDGKRVFCLRRHSLIKPDTSVVLAKIVVPGSWTGLTVIHLTSRIVMVMIRPMVGRQLRLFLIDKISRTSRDFVIESPEVYSVISFAYVFDGHLHIVFDKSGNNRLEFIDVKYALPQGSQQDRVSPVSSESITFPIGQRNSWEIFFNQGFPMVMMAYDESALENNDAHLCFTFDHNKQWRMETLTKWLATYGNTERGAKILKAAHAITALSPPANVVWFKVPAIREFYRLITSPRCDELFFKAFDGGLLHRWINPPSLKRLAAQAIFRAYPQLKIREVEVAIGVEISDGIPEDEKEEEAPVVYL